MGCLSAIFPLKELNLLPMNSMLAMAAASVILILSISAVFISIVIQSIEGLSVKISAIGIVGFLVTLWALRWLVELNTAWKKEIYIQTKQDTNRIWATWTYDRDTWPYVVSEFDRNWNYLRWVYTAMSVVGVGAAVFQSELPWWQSALWALGAGLATWGAVLWAQKRKTFKQLNLKEKEVVFHPDNLLIGKDVFPLNYMQNRLDKVDYEPERQLIKFTIHVRAGKYSRDNLIQIPLTEASRQAEAERLAAQYRAFHQLK